MLVSMKAWRCSTRFALAAGVVALAMPLFTRAALQGSRVSDHGPGGQIDLHMQEVPPVMEVDDYFVDAHAHPISGDVLLQVMAQNHVGYAIVSYPGDRSKQNELAEFARRYPQMVPIRWWDPRSDRPADIEYDLKVRGFKGLKYHPPTIGMPISDPRNFPFIELARKYRVPIVVHTAIDDVSRPFYLTEMARKYPEIQWIMYHLELGALDKSSALAEAAKVKNMAVETSWTNATGVIKAIGTLGPQRVLFGTDAVTDGLDHFNRRNIPDNNGQFTLNYKDVIAQVRQAVPKNAYEDWAFRNTIRMFKIPIGSTVQRPRPTRYQ